MEESAMAVRALAKAPGQSASEGLLRIMAEPRQREGPVTNLPSAESISQVRAEFTSSWEAALRGDGFPPRIHPFLTRAAEADRPDLERELTEIDQEFCKRFPPASIWMGGTVDQKTDTPGPEGLATIDSIRQQESGMPSCDPAGTLDDQRPCRLAFAETQTPRRPRPGFQLSRRSLGWRSQIADENEIRRRAD